MRRRFSNLRIRLLILVVLAAAPAFGVLIYDNSERRQVAAARAQDQALQLAHVIAADQMPMLEGGHQLLTTLAQLPELRGGDPAACSTLLGVLLKQYPRYANLGVVGPDGNVLCTALSSSSSVNYGDRSWFQRAVETHDLAIGEYTIGQISGRPVLHLAYPSYEDEQLRAVVYASLDLGWLDEMVAQSHWPQQTVIGIVDRNGTLIARSPEPKERTRQTFPTNQAVQAILSQREGVIDIVGSGGVSYLYAFTPIGNAPRADVYVVVGIPSAIAFEDINNRIARDLAALAIATAFALLATWLGADWFILRQVRALRRAAGRLQIGDLSARSGLASEQGELGQLAWAFDEMAKTLQAQETLRDQSEQAMREQYQFLETVIESLTHPFYIVQARDYQVVMANKAARQAGLPSSSTCYSLVHGNPKPCSEFGTPCPLDQVLTTRQPVTIQHVHYDSHGNARDVQVIASPILDSQGHVTRVIEYDMDVTERNRAEEALADEKERLAVTLASIGDGLITTDTDEKVVLLNPVAEQLTGWTQADAMGKDLLDVFHIINGKTREPVRDPAKQALASQAVQGLVADTVLVARDGVERFVSSSVAPVRDRYGQIGGVALVFRDVTLLKRAEEALVESREFTHSLIDSSLDMIIAVDNDRRITAFNRAAQGTFGYTFDEALGKHISILYADHVQGDSVHKTVLETGHCVDEVLNRRKDGGVFPCYLSASLLRNARGETIGLMGISRDITKLKQAEEQNIKAERLAALGRMAATLAHEINNPLQAMQSTLDLVLDFSLEPPQRDAALQRVRHEIERLSTINQRILHFARPMPGPRHILSISKLVEQTLTLAGKHLQHAHIQVTTDLQGDPLALAAPEQLVQVILNMVLNAIEATGEDGHLAISVWARDRYTFLSFTNDGPPIPLDVIGRIFEPFFTTKPDGSGLGLSVSQAIVQQHGGTLSVENLDRGVRFTIQLPRVWKELE